MRIYLAGYYNGKAAAYEIEGYPYFLESYHYINKQRLVDAIRRDGRQVFLDSGAFSAFTQGIDIDIPKYVDYIKRNEDIIEVASVLDGIGDPVKTLENQKKMEDLGVNPLPCFHYGEPVEYLEHYLANYDHITLGGMVPIATPPLLKWLDEIWDQYLTNPDGTAKIKVHGFGLTSMDPMFRYPWYSVDSTSWVLTGRFGSIYWPTPRNPAGKLVISDQSPSRREFGKHYDSMSGVEQEACRAHIESKGFDVEELRSVYWKRDLWNIAYFQELCDLPPPTFKKTTKGLFDA